MVPRKLNRKDIRQCGSRKTEGLFLAEQERATIMSLNVFPAGSKEKGGDILEKPAGLLIRGEMST